MTRSSGAADRWNQSARPGGSIRPPWVSSPLETLAAGASPDRTVLDLMTMRDPEERCGYVFAGNSRDLDHWVIDPRLEAALVSGSFGVVHVNAEFARHAGDRDP
jgi:hypothetical protein